MFVAYWLASYVKNPKTESRKLFTVNNV